MHLDAGCDSARTREPLIEPGCEARVAAKGKPAPIQLGNRWVVERTTSQHARGFRKLAIRTERRTAVINALISLANTIIVIRRLIREAWTTHRWHTRRARRPLTHLLAQSLRR